MFSCQKKCIFKTSPSSKNCKQNHLNMADIIPDQIVCKTCENIFSGKYCNNCGQPVIKRFTGNFLWQGIHQDIFEVDRGLLLTYKEMWLNAGGMVLKYIGGETKRYYSPLKYLIFWTAVFLIIQPFMNGGGEQSKSFEDLIFNSHLPFSNEAMQDFTFLLMRLTFSYTNLYFLGLIPFVSVINYFFHRKGKFNLTEIMILNTYFFGHMGSFLVVVALVSIPLDNLNIDSIWVMIVGLITSIPFIVLFIISQKQFFKQKWSTTIFKGIGTLYGGITVYLFFLWLLFITIKYSL